MNIKIINKINELDNVVKKYKKMQHTPDLIFIDVDENKNYIISERYYKRDKLGKVLPGCTVKNIKLDNLSDYMFNSDFRGNVYFESVFDEPLKYLNLCDFLQIREKIGENKNFVIADHDKNTISIQVIEIE